VNSHCNDRGVEYSLGEALSRLDIYVFSCLMCAAEKNDNRRNLVVAVKRSLSEEKDDGVSFSHFIKFHLCHIVTR